MSEKQSQKEEQYRELVEKIVGKIKNIGMELHRAIPNQWNAFMEICMAGSITE